MDTANQCRELGQLSDREFSMTIKNIYISKDFDNSDSSFQLSSFLPIDHITSTEALTKSVPELFQQIYSNNEKSSYHTLPSVNLLYSLIRLQTTGR